MTDKIKDVRVVLFDLEKKIDNSKFEEFRRGIFIEDALEKIDVLYKAKYLGMLPEERIMKPSTTKEEADNPLLLFEDGKLIGFNSAIQETKRRMNEEMSLL